MARPKPTILLEQTNENFYSEQVLSATAIFAVFYSDAPISIKTINSISDIYGAKYKKTSFSNKAHAIRLAKRLNKKFATTKFIVKKLLDGELIFKAHTDSRNCSAPYR